MRRAIIVNTRLEIIQTGLQLFLERGYENTTWPILAKELKIGYGNIGYYFKTKEHLLEVLAQEVCNFHQMVLDSEIEEGKTSLLAYCMELTAMAAVCDTDATAKDLYLAMYTHRLPLKTIRVNDLEKTKAVFAEFNPDWTDQNFAYAENLVSGIEYATLQTDNADTVSLKYRIEKSLRTILQIYNVPGSLREQKINKIFAMDFHRIGNRFIKELRDYIITRNDEAMQKAKEEYEEKYGPISQKFTNKFAERG